MASQAERATDLLEQRSREGAAPPRLLSVGLACVDIINSVVMFPGEDQCCRGTSQRRARGGNASNSAVVAAQCGVATWWLGTLPRLASADARFCVADLEAHGARALPVERPTGERCPGAAQRF